MKQFIKPSSEVQQQSVVDPKPQKDKQVLEENSASATSGTNEVSASSAEEKVSWADMVEQEAQSTNMVNLPYREKKWYVLFNTPRKGIYQDWSQITPMINGVSGAIHKSFATLEGAKKAYAEFQQIAKIKAPAIPPEPIIPTQRKLAVDRQQLYASIKKKEEMPKAFNFTKERRSEAVQAIFEWKEGEQQLKGSYPTYFKSQVKVILLPEVNLVLAYSMFLLGMVKQIIVFDSFKHLENFPPKMVDSIKRLWEVTRIRTLCITIRSSIPLFAEEDIRVPSLSVITVTHFNGRLDPIEVPKELDFSEEAFYSSVKEVFEKSQSINDYSRFRILYRTSSTIMFGVSLNELTQKHIDGQRRITGK
ncbi:PREDICTED: uncharacterized protein LOC109224493 [Nicotiana attenuata]|uniref:uncharacterized protein LOC109224493 n=1 Tax=Nicotiana attenuata TaxID=49451 RepID=UPI000904B667|nr:PREDICTED: uncharacterized protein LOC109224493 [Nicotiana attenuata]